MQSLYGDSLRLADDTPFSFDDATFEDAAGVVYANGGFNISQFKDPKVRKLIGETLRVIDTAISVGLPHEVSDTARNALENNAFIFSGFKTYHSLREVGLSLVTDKGDIKPYADFLTDVRRVNATYNHNYLYAEYNHAVAASLMAAKWQDFERDGDRYDLQYRTAGDNRVREEHAILNGTTLPPSDPFWAEYLPPNGWNCFVAGTPVLTADGWKPIEEIKRGDSVFGGSGNLRKVTATHSRNVKAQLVRIVTKGAAATCTENHRFLTGRGWVAAGDLHAGDILIQVAENSTLHKLIHAISNTATLCRQALVAHVAQRKTVASLAVNHQPQRGDIEVGHVARSYKNVYLELQAACRQIAGYDFLGLAQWLAQCAHTLRMGAAGRKAAAQGNGANFGTQETALFCHVSPLCGLRNPNAFDGFHSFLDFLRNSFLHCRYVFIEDKVTEKKAETAVFNLSIEQDESYIVPIGIAHNCRCTAVQVRKGKYPTSDPALAKTRGDNCTEGEKRKIFRFNAGKSLQLFPPKHPYYKAPGDAKQPIFEGARRNADKNAVEAFRESPNLQTGKLHQTRKAMKRAIRHTFDLEQLQTMLTLPDHLHEFRFVRFSPLGEGKDMTRAENIKNIAEKRRREVTGYNVYKATINGITWIVKTEIFKNSSEMIYHIKKE